MEEFAIIFENVTKKYKLYKKNNDKLLSLIFKKKNIKEKVALSDVSFKIKKGETVALLGDNGAGKSTIVKLVSDLSYPTSGKVIVNGKKSTLLGTNVGLENNFTGRENIYLKCSLLGLNKEEIKKIENKIIEFSEIEEYIDYPMKTYSSGMKARLGFSILSQIEADVLIIDETLSVGDEKFKKKCANRIKEIIAEKKATLLFVTHSINTVSEFCNRGIVLKKGKKVYDGDIFEAKKIYLN